MAGKLVVLQKKNHFIQPMGINKGCNDHQGLPFASVRFSPSLKGTLPRESPLIRTFAD
jgi:hypothetical protein